MAFYRCSFEKKVNLGTKNIIANGTYSASGDSLDGYSQVVVNVPNNMGDVQFGYFTPSADIISNVGADIADYTGNALYAQLFAIDNAHAVLIPYCILDMNTSAAYGMNSSASGMQTSSVVKLSFDNETHKLHFGGTSNVFKLAKDIKYMWMVYTA